MILKNTSFSASASAGCAAASTGGAAPSEVDPAMWRAAAGSFVQMPSVGSRVYYFPQGHFEQCLSATSTGTLSAVSGAGGGGAAVELASPPPAFFLCRVLSVRFLCHPVTDQPFASLHLESIPFGTSSAASELSNGGTAVAADVSNFGYNMENVVMRKENVGGVDVSSFGFSRENVVGDVSDGGYKRKENVDGVVSGYVEEEDVVSFTKVLTPSDANNGGGFSVPRFCADSIFPPLDLEADPPVQNLVIRDVHGTSYSFRHIYRGTPRRHLLTTGWSKFVNSKKLVAGDSVVFMRRRRTGELYAGVRRLLRIDDVFETWNCPLKSVKIEKSRDDEWTVGKGVIVDAVLNTLEKAVRGMAFEVIFYPRPGWSEFIVKAESVEKAMEVVWIAGLRVKLPMETEDSTRTTWFQGTVTSATVPDHGPWRGSPWRMLQVAWDEPEMLQHVNRVNPWQVELVSASLYAPLPPPKKIKPWEDLMIMPNRGERSFSKSGLPNTSMAQLTTSYLDLTFFPAGMQGARQIQDSGSFLYGFLKDGIDKMHSEEVTDNNMQQKLETLSTELNIGSLPSDTSSVDNSSCFTGTGPEGKQDSSSSTKVGQRSIQLFGKIIAMERPAEDSGGNDEYSS